MRQKSGKQRATVERVVKDIRRRYHESLGNLTPADVYLGRGDDILSERRTIKNETLKQRRLLNQRQAA